MAKKDKSHLCVSRYNLGFKKNQGSCLFNTRTGAFLKLEDTPFENLEWLIVKRSKPINGKPVSTGLLTALEAGGFIVKNDFNELEALKFHHQVIRTARQNDSCSVVILPTLRCNMRCKYCFEWNRESPRMSKEVRDKLLKYLRDRLKNGCKQLYLEWFGGEPLMNMPLVRDLSKAAIRLCRAHKAKYASSMITNGTLLTKERALELKRLRINKIQVTLDGPPAVHDSRRPLVNGKGTFDTILKNIETVCRIINISIRCNIDKSNVQYADELCKILAGRGLTSRVRLYFSPVHSGAHICSDAGKPCSGMFTQKSFAAIEPKLQKMLQSHGFGLDSPPTPSFSSCGATDLNDFVIDPNGNLYKCGETVGMKEEAVGHISRGFTFNNTLFKWTNFSALDSKRCLGCKVLPICMGWCPIKKHQDPGDSTCYRMKFNIIKQLSLMSGQKQPKQSDPVQ